MMKRKYGKERGVALIFAIGLLSLLLVIGLAFVANALSAKKVSNNNSARTQSKMFALSAANRAAASVMIYQHQIYMDDSFTEFPENFASIYSYGKVNDNKESDDCLLGKSDSDSVLLLPEDNTVLSKAAAIAYNKPLKNDAKESWKGKWVYFYNTQDLSSDDCRIIGRAAWQVLSNSAQISAPVFFRGNLGEKSGDTSHAADQHRWGRDIYEVKLNNTTHFTGVPGSYDGKRITDFVALYENGTITAADATEKRWVERWLTPDPDAASDNGAAWDPNATKITPEVYYYQENDKKARAQLVRFNVSGLYNSGVNMITQYGVSASADPWYARFRIDSTSSSETDHMNSDYALADLTRDSKIYVDFDEYDYNVTSRDDRSGLPFLRRIGREGDTVPYTFDKIDDLRKQIAANLNDYCDADSIPTSDVKATEWKTSATEPTYTGNEKTPYLYELGAQIGFFNATAGAQSAITCTFSGSTPEGEQTGSFNFGMKLAPMVKLANIYAFNPTETPSCSTLKAYLDFGLVKTAFKLEKIVLRDIEFQYKVDDNYVTKAIPEIVIDTIQSATPENCPDNLKNTSIAATISSGALSAGNALTFSDEEVTNTTGNHPYPFKYSTDATLFQSIDSVTLDTPGTLKLQLSEAYVKKYAEDNSLLPSGATFVKITKQPISMDVQKIQLTQLSVLPKKSIVLTATVNGVADTGIDYVRQFSETASFKGFEWVWTSESTPVYLVTEGASPAAGLLMSLARCYDPRQNLNNADWYPHAATAGGAKLANSVVGNTANYLSPTAAELSEVMGVSSSGTGIANTCYSSDSSTSAKLFVPSGKGTSGDTEEVSEPGYKSTTEHISTAFIRNAPMMSPWELGLIHRGIRWQTINLKSSYDPNTGSVPVRLSSYDANGSSWNKSGTTYAGGDAGLLDQIKMTQQCATYGKINVNMFNVNKSEYDATRDLDIFKALFDGVRFGEPIATFLANSKRTDGNFVGNSTGTALTADASALANMAAAGNASSLKVSSAQSTSTRYLSRAQLVDFKNGSAKLANAFGLVEEGENDAELEELIGKTINLLTAETTSPNQVQIIVVAQSIKDVAGKQFRPTTATTLSGVNKSVSIADGMASATCEYGKFDAGIHSTDDGKNVYFDEITGEVKMLVTLDRDPTTGKMSIRRIDYLE